MPIKVNNLFPVLTATYRIAFIGEAPGKDEESSGIPFYGQSGKFFNALLSKAGIVRDACYIGNVCQYRPENNIIATFDFEGEEIQSGIRQLDEDLAKFKPNLIVPLGNLALHYTKSPTQPLRKKKVEKKPAFVYHHSIDSWRGSKYLSTAGTKCLGSYHPAFCLRQYDNTPFLMMDLFRIAREGLTPELTIPQRLFDINPTAEQIVYYIRRIRQERPPTSLDIEGGLYGISMISVSTDPAYAFLIRFYDNAGNCIYSLDDETTITRALAELLADPLVPKVWQNGLYDRFVNQYGFSMPVYGNQDDTMPKWWEKYCELPKGLDTQMSVLTEEPYYKGDRKSTDDETFCRYCCKDSSVTLEINNKLTPLVAAHSPGSIAHYRFNHDLLNLFLYIELRGIRYDSKLARTRLSEVAKYQYALQYELDAAAGYGLNPKWQPSSFEDLARFICCHKKDPNTPRKEHEELWPHILATCRKPDKTPEDLGFLSIQLGTDLNIKSPVFKSYLYDKLKLPEKLGKSGSRTTDALALLKLLKEKPSRVLEVASRIALLRTRTTFLSIAADPDGRIRCGYNVTGSNTGRITCYTSPTGSGYNLQTLPDEDESKPVGDPLRNGMRDLVLADADHYLFQCDLKGSDGWTIGAHLARLGAPAMLDDLKNGIKPANRIAYMLRHGLHSLKGKQLDEVRELLKEVKKTDWDYFCCKVLIWGICYLMGVDLCADQVFDESDGKVKLNRNEVKEFHQAVHEGYQVKRWHEDMARKILKDPTITAASGHKRRFYGRPTEILGEALAFEPQANTTYATNLAAHKLWHDPDNRTDRLVGSVRVPFRIEPLHQVHDALIGQFAIVDCGWATEKIRGYFDNPLTIAGQKITIPFTGNYGTSWGDLSVGEI